MGLQRSFFFSLCSLYVSLMGQVSDDPPRMEGELGHWEKVLCIVGWTAAALYSCLNVYWMSQGGLLSLMFNSLASVRCGRNH